MSRPQGTNDLDISWAIRDISPEIISFTERALLWFFLSMIGNKDLCWLNFEQLSKKTGLSVRSLRDHINHLERLNLIQVIRPNVKGRGHSNEYLLNYSEIIKQAKSAYITEESRQNLPVLDTESRQNFPIKPAKFASHRYTEEIHKSRESAPKKKGAPLTKDFIIDDELIERFEKMGFDEESGVPEIKKFFAHYLSNGETRVDWEQALVKWMISAAQYLKLAERKKQKRRPLAEPRQNVKFYVDTAVGIPCRPETAFSHLSEIMAKLKPHTNSNGIGEANGNGIRKEMAY